RRLIRNQAEAHLGHGHGGEHRLRALTCVAAEQTVYLARGARPQSLERGVAGLATKLRGTGLFAEALVGERQFAHAGAYVIRPVANGVVDPRNRYASVVVVEGGKD